MCDRKAARRRGLQRGVPLVPSPDEAPNPLQPRTRLPPHPSLNPIPAAAPTPRELPGRIVLDEEDASVPADAVGPPARQVQPVDVIPHGGGGGGTRAQSSPTPQGGTGHGTQLGKRQTTPGSPRSKPLLSSDLPPRLCLLQITKEGGKKKNPNQTHQLNPLGAGLPPCLRAGVQRASSQHRGTALQMTLQG